MSENISTKTLSLLDTQTLFSNVDKRHKKDIGCNLLLIKILDNNLEHYAIQEFDNLTNKTIIRIPSEDELEYLKSMLFLDGNKVCKYDITGEYLQESFETGNICFVLFSRHVDPRTRTVEAVVNVCGLLFLGIIRRTTSKDMYIKLICSESRSVTESSGLGTKFMNMAETMGKITKCKRVLLSSVDTPLGFYLSKDYKPVSGPSLYEIPEEIKIPIFKRGKILQSSLMQKAQFLNSMGMATTFTDATRLLPSQNNNRSLRRTPRESAGRRFLGNGTIGALSGVKLDIDPSSEMVIMEKVLTDNASIAEGKQKIRKTRGSMKKGMRFRKKNGRSRGKGNGKRTSIRSSKKN
jgi:hypothetical protein